jgi:hypothetical protein
MVWGTLVLLNVFTTVPPSWHQEAGEQAYFTSSPSLQMEKDAEEEIYCRFEPRHLARAYILPCHAWLVGRACL